MSIEDETLQIFEITAIKYGYKIKKGQGASNRICSVGKIYFQFGDLRVETKDYTIVIEVESAGGVTNLLKYWYALKKCRENFKKRIILLHIYLQSSIRDYQSHLNLWDFLWGIMKNDVGDMIEAYRYNILKDITNDNLKPVLHQFEELLKSSVPPSKEEMS